MEISSLNRLSLRTKPFPFSIILIEDTMLDEIRVELSTKPVEIVLAYMDCYDEFVSLRWDEGDFESICDFSHFYRNAMENWAMFEPTSSECQYLNGLLREYGYEPRF